LLTALETIEMPTLPVDVEAWHNAFWCCDTRGRLTYFNASASAMLAGGLTNNSSDFVHPDDRRLIQDLHLRSACGLSERCVLIRCMLNGRYEPRIVHCQEQFDLKGQLEGFLCYIDHPAGLRTTRPAASTAVGIKVDGVLTDLLSGPDVRAYPGTSLHHLNLMMEDGTFEGYFFTNDNGTAVRGWLSQALSSELGGNQDTWHYQGTLHETEPEVVRALGIGLYLTDDPDEVLHYRVHGIRAYLVRRPWNAHAEMPFIVDSLDAFLSMLS